MIVDNEKIELIEAEDIAAVEESDTEETTAEAVDSEMAVIELSEEEKAAAAKELKLKLEGILFASDKPLSPKQLNALFPETEAPSVGEIRGVLKELQQDYEDRGVHLVEISSGYCFRATALIAPYVGEMIGEKAPRYSRAFLETLAIIAYRQPITRGEIEQIRGVAVNSQILKTLQERDWIREVGHKEVPGRPALLATTRVFLDYFHLNQLSDLPPLAELLSEQAQIEQAEKQITIMMEEQELPAAEAPAEITEEIAKEITSEETTEALEFSEGSVEEIAEEVVEETQAEVEEPISELSDASEENEHEATHLA